MVAQELIDLGINAAAYHAGMTAQTRASVQESITWREFSKRVLRWRKAFAKMGLTKGDRVAMLLPNSLDAVTFDQAALANGLVTVPLHASDTAGSSRYILADSGSRFLVTVSLARWHSKTTNHVHEL